LANPGAAYGTNWNSFVFSLATPIAALIAVLWFVPFYRRSGNVSAYEHMEERFGAWARTYAVACFLLYQMARMGMVIYLLGNVVSPLTGFPVSATIIATGTLMTIYTLAGGIKAVVWTGVLQSFVLVGGTLVCIAMILMGTSGGVTHTISAGAAADKFSLGSFGPSFYEATFWVTFMYGVVTHLANFGVDQSYVQRYMTARNDREASKSVWITTLMYVPAAAVYFFIGTALFVYYGDRPGLLPANIEPDDVFPYFIATGLPTGMAGLVVAAIFAASMDSNLNSMATLTLLDFYKRYLRPNAGERESMRVLHISTAAWGALCIAMGLALIQVPMALEAWWKLAGVLSGGVLALFLIGLMSRRIDRVAAVIAVILGELVMLWMFLSGWFQLKPPLGSPLHANLTLVVGTVLIFIVSTGLTTLRSAFRSRTV
jgi:SSS family solute:Na+ symporter